MRGANRSRTVLRTSVTLCAALAGACGRVAFEPLDDARGSGSGDTTPVGDGGADGPGAMGDAPASACASAMPVSVGTTTIDTCSTGLDLFDGCGPPGTREVVLRFDVPATGSYTFAARDPGTQNVTTATGVIGAGCMGLTSCGGIFATSYAAGQVVYLVLEEATGGCKVVELDIQ